MINEPKLLPFSALIRARFDRRHLVVAVLALIGLAVVQDALQSAARHGPFFLSESALFRAVWGWFIPILWGQHWLWQRQTWVRNYRLLAVSGMAIVSLLAHAVLFAASVYVVSLIFFGHTYTMGGTLVYTFGEDLISYVGVYGAWSIYLFNTTTTFVQPPTAVYDTSISVRAGQQTTVLELADVLFITAASPYVLIHTATRQYLYSTTLTTLAHRLPSQQFVRIHRTCIVNRRYVSMYTSRLNGDYDLRLTNGAQLRLSRTYVAAFKALMDSPSGQPKNSSTHPV